MKTSLKRELLDHGATVVGIAGLRGYLSGEISPLGPGCVHRRGPEAERGHPQPAGEVSRSAPSGS